MIHLLLIAAISALCLLYVYVFLLLPSRSHKKELEQLKVNYAHRGLHGNGIPENSLAAASEAIKEGYGIELDVRLSADGIVMVFHDDTLKRMCGIDKRFDELTYDELKALRLGESCETIPTFGEFLDRVKGRVPLLIEIKTGKENDILCREVCEHLRGYCGCFGIKSFDPTIVRWFRHYRPDIIRGQLVMKMTKKSGKSAVACFALSNLLLNVISRPDFISVQQSHEPRLSIRLCRFFGAAQFIWTVRDKKDAERLTAKEKNIIFENFTL